jgi:drug/metabolite transporter (DMT)-like permease
VLYGLLAALGWGTADLMAAVSGRRIGSSRTVAIAQVTSLAALVAAGVVLGQGFSVEATGITIMLFNGVIAAAAYVTLYRGLELGPVALVSPIVASYAAISIVLAVVINGESLGPLLVAGIVLALGGAVVASVDPRQLRRGEKLLQAGIPWAIASLVLFGVATFVLGDWSQRIGWYPASLLSRVGNVAGVLVFALVVRRQAPSVTWSMRAVATAALVGVADIVGVIAFARGAELGMISVVTAVASAFILIPVVGGFVLFRERPAWTQLVGVTAVFAGLVLLGSGS